MYDGTVYLVFTSTKSKGHRNGRQRTCSCSERDTQTPDERKSSTQIKSNQIKSKQILHFQIKSCERHRDCADARSARTRRKNLNAHTQTASALLRDHGRVYRRSYATRTPLRADVSLTTVRGPCEGAPVVTTGGGRDVRREQLLRRVHHAAASRIHERCDSQKIPLEHSCTVNQTELGTRVTVATLSVARPGVAPPSTLPVCPARGRAVLCGSLTAAQSVSMGLCCSSSDAGAARGRRHDGNISMHDVRAEVDAAGSGAGIVVCSDGSALSSTWLHNSSSRVSLRLRQRAVRGCMRVEFRITGEAYVAFGYALQGAVCLRGDESPDVGTQLAWCNHCHERGVRVPGAPFREIRVGGSAALLFDMDAGTLGYEVNGEFVGTLFRDLQGLAIVPVFFLGAGAAAARRLTARARECALPPRVRAPCCDVSRWLCV